MSFGVVSEAINIEAIIPGWLGLGFVVPKDFEVWKR
jgi:hypothetical protein